jgi:hypothetical protein
MPLKNLKLPTAWWIWKAAFYPPTEPREYGTSLACDGMEEAMAKTLCALVLIAAET